jgi:bifunctional UDP-N-acetylglucosamine pyrophosphorylase/glucosamine-1-phosphate N-acetyltransferase
MVIGKLSYIAAATCVTEDVPQDSLAIGRARQVTKEGWAKTKRESLAKQVEHRVLSVIAILR